MDLLPIVKIANRAGEPIAGVTMSSAPAVEEKLKRTSKPHCFVLAWIVIDVEEADILAPVGSHLLPMVMYGHHVVFDSTGRLKQGDAVLTQFATYYDARGIFETADTVHILLQQGFRKTAHMDTVRAAWAGTPGR
ncbi:hypothetical protein SOM55_09180 [Pseudomonas coleopterorum]|uniref:DUF6957 family protein n=1 Tax=Pseudomonas coleopterorum TaxID=1605838 RepID=UPI002A6ADF3F|nr:hypothetical protein [Pseudomonas coleopterorum]MDY1046972.1 hypothetical protein [Pseudomonas coleopterorum]